MDATLPDLWDLIRQAARLQARALHLHVGRVPAVRGAMRELEPLDPGAAPLDARAMAIMLSRVVDPDAWDRLEAEGQGEVSLSQFEGRPVRLSLFRHGGQWSAVVFL